MAAAAAAKQQPVCGGGQQPFLRAFVSSAEGGVLYREGPRIKAAQLETFPCALHACGRLGMKAGSGPSLAPEGGGAVVYILPGVVGRVHPCHVGLSSCVVYLNGIRRRRFWVFH